MHKPLREYLTNEMLTKHFPDNFSLALKAIETASNHIKAGRQITLSGALEELTRAQSKKDEPQV